MTFAAVIDSSTVIALVRGGVFEYLGQVFQPLFIDHGAERECRKVLQIDAALNQTQLGVRPFPIVVTLITHRRINARVLKASEAAALRANPVFNQVESAMLRVSGGAHATDIRHAAYTAAMGIPFVGDNTFVRFIRQSFATSRHARGLSCDVRNIDDIATLLGYS